jgi:hypothetical protein
MTNSPVPTALMAVFGAVGSGRKVGWNEKLHVRVLLQYFGCGVGVWVSGGVAILGFAWLGHGILGCHQPLVLPHFGWQGT